MNSTREWPDGMMLARRKGDQWGQGEWIQAIHSDDAAIGFHFRRHDSRNPADDIEVLSMTPDGETLIQRYQLLNVPDPECAGEDDGGGIAQTIPGPCGIRLNTAGPEPARPHGIPRGAPMPPPDIDRRYGLENSY